MQKLIAIGHTSRRKSRKTSVYLKAAFDRYEHDEDNDGEWKQKEQRNKIIICRYYKGIDLWISNQHRWDNKCWNYYLQDYIGTKMNDY